HRGGRTRSRGHPIRPLTSTNLSTIKNYSCRDSSRNKNLSLTADNGTKKFSVKITYQAKDNPSNLSFFVVSGCYQVPDGQKIEQF
ncbi:hypothetical protein ACFYTG_54865, partial [Streptomyces mirabilis]